MIFHGVSLRVNPKVKVTPYTLTDTLIPFTKWISLFKNFMSFWWKCCQAVTLTISLTALLSNSLISISQCYLILIYTYFLTVKE